MSNGKPTVAEVVAEANAARAELAVLERDLQEEIDAIDLTAFKEGRERTAEELARRKERRASQAEVREGFKVLAFVTAQRLDDTAEVAQLSRARRRPRRLSPALRHRSASPASCWRRPEPGARSPIPLPHTKRPPALPGVFWYGGERGIRTLETVSRLHAFQACAFSHSAISPQAEPGFPKGS